MTALENINTPAYWDRRFETDWRESNGYEQTAAFARLALTSLPAALLDLLRDERLTVVDFGCAAGQGVKLWAERVDGADRVEGVDFSTTVVHQARSLHPGLHFSVADLDSMRPYDVVFSSNTLEHFDAPRAALERLAAKARKYLVLLLPFRESAPLHAEHRVSFDRDSFPLQLGGGSHALVWSKILDMSGSGFWEGSQLLLVYASPEAVSLSSVTLAHLGGEAPLTRDALVPASPRRCGGPVADDASAGEIRRLRTEVADLRLRLGATRAERERAEAVEGQLQAAHAEIDRLLASQAEAVRRQRELTEELDGLQRKLEKADLQVAASLHEAAEASRRGAEHQQRLSAAEAEIRWLRNTRSWKLTSPLRRATALKRQAQELAKTALHLAAVQAAWPSAKR